MTERPILFSDAMVRAIQSGRKWQTRRVVDWKKVAAQSGCRRGTLAWSEMLKGWAVFDGDGPAALCEVKCPYGAPCDELWVRETWRVSKWFTGERISVAFKDGAEHVCPELDDFFFQQWRHRMWMQSSDDCFKAGLIIGDDNCFHWPDGRNEMPTRWRPSIHMPKFAARIWLRVVKVRVERLQDFTEGDSQAEGVERPIAPPDIPGGHPYTGYYRDAFRDLWDSINKSRGFGWDENPWVWVVEFRRVKDA